MTLFVIASRRCVKALVMQRHAARAGVVGATPKRPEAQGPALCNVCQTVCSCSRDGRQPGKWCLASEITGYRSTPQVSVIRDVIRDFRRLGRVVNPHEVTVAVVNGLPAQLKEPSGGRRRHSHWSSWRVVLARRKKNVCGSWKGKDVSVALF